MQAHSIDIMSPAINHFACLRHGRHTTHVYTHADTHTHTHTVTTAYSIAIPNHPYIGSRINISNITPNTIALYQLQYTAQCQNTAPTFNTFTHHTASVHNHSMLCDLAMHPSHQKRAGSINIIRICQRSSQEIMARQPRNIILYRNSKK